MKIFIAALLLVGLCIIGLCFNIIFRKDGKFPETEIENNKEMRKRDQMRKRRRNEALGQEG